MSSVAVTAPTSKCPGNAVYSTNVNAARNCMTTQMPTVMTRVRWRSVATMNATHDTSVSTKHAMRVGMQNGTEFPSGNPRKKPMTSDIATMPTTLAARNLRLVASLLFITGQTNSAGAASVANLVSGEWALWFWIGLVAVGLVLPTVLELWLLFFSPKEFEESRKAHWISFASDISVLVGGFMLRYLVVMAAVPLTMVVALA